MTVRYAVGHFAERYNYYLSESAKFDQKKEALKRSLEFHFGRCSLLTPHVVRLNQEELDKSGPWVPADLDLRGTTVYVHPADFKRMKQICIDSGEMKEEDFAPFRLGFKWTAGEAGYEVSTKGDLRFSAFHARMYDRRTVEQHYQCDVKGYDPGGTDWRRGKGNPPLTCTVEEARAAYYRLWELWAMDNQALIKELYWKAVEHDYTLSDSFATSETNQAAALVRILDRML